MEKFKNHLISTNVYGSYLVQQTKHKKVSPLLVGFHGYGETAENQLTLLQQFPGIETWAVCSIQALHPFYNTRGKIGYSWMTSHERELRINENIEYVNKVIQEIKKHYMVNDTIVYHGFSQGTAMACRAALLGRFKTSGVILLAGDIPPEIKQIDKIKRILIARGKKDKFYSSVRWKKDVIQVKNSNVESYICEFDGGHNGHQDYFTAVGTFLNYYE